VRHPLSIHALLAAARWRRFRRRVGGRLARLTGPPDRAPRPERPRVPAARIEEALEGLGVGAGDRVLVHSGLSRLGRVEAGAGGMLDRLRARVGERGTLLFPAFPFHTLMVDYVQHEPEFDARTSPTRMGMLAERALRAPDRLRSLHPTHGVAALGADAEAFTTGHEQDPTPFGPHSPYRRLADGGGKILALGVGLGSVTSFHEVEDRMGDRFPVRVYLDRAFELRGRDDDGEAFVARTLCHDPLLSAVRDCMRMDAPLREAGVLRSVPVGAAEVLCLDAGGLTHVLEQQATRKRTIYGRIWG